MLDDEDVEQAPHIAAWYLRLSMMRKHYLFKEMMGSGI